MPSVKKKAGSDAYGNLTGRRQKSLKCRRPRGHGDNVMAVPLRKKMGLGSKDGGGQVHKKMDA